MMNHHQFSQWRLLFLLVLVGFGDTTSASSPSSSQTGLFVQSFAVPSTTANHHHHQHLKKYDPKRRIASSSPRPHRHYIIVFNRYCNH